MLTLDADLKVFVQSILWGLRKNDWTTAWCNEIGSLMSPDMHLSYMHPLTSENQFHCTKLYKGNRWYLWKAKIILLWTAEIRKGYLEKIMAIDQGLISLDHRLYKGEKETGLLEDFDFSYCSYILWKDGQIVQN